MIRGRLLDIKNQLNLDARIQLLSGQLNRLTGYERIENLKAVVIKAEQSIKQSRTMLIDSKREYTKYTELRRQSQKQVNDLLSNKSSWGDTELNKFTQLVKSDHSIEKLEKEFMQKVEEYEKLVDRGFEKLLKSILERYHEEQIWSDKIRSMSSNYTLIALSVNVLVFLMAIVFIEPYKRNRMLRELEINLDKDQVKILSQIDSIREEISTLKTPATVVDQPDMPAPLGPEPPSTSTQFEKIYNNPFTTLSIGILIALGLYLFSNVLHKYKNIFSINFKPVWLIIISYTLVVLSSLVLYTSTANDLDSKAFIPTLTYIALLLTLCYPFNALFRHQRFQFIGTLGEIVYSPFQVTFNQVLLADILTSYAKVFGDFYTSLVQCLDPESNFAITPPSANYMAPVFTAIPYILRFKQCIVEYVASNFTQKKSLLNALKYASSFPVIAFSALHRYNNTAYNWWLISVIVNSLFSFWWDVRNDWGLNFLDSDVWLRNGSTQKTSLRDVQLYKESYKYYVAIFIDFILRFTWSLKLSSHLHTYVELESGVFALEILEIFRRYLWCFFRLEWQVIKSNPHEYTSIPIHQYNN
ncbi:EXS-domain-containing protein [Wallemia mellicola]|uniref:Sensitive to high expression protein 9, mitochondrial n=1 Tax=Wallemia mellicola TaxID=1708541 RepID=A0A4T0MFZ6_9BASI|nr:EXS-domain-containing protein [Wallemia mellicola]